MAKKQQHGEMPEAPEFPASLFAWPALMAASVGEAIAASLAAPHAKPAGERRPAWATPHRVRLELGTMQLRDFSTGESGVATLICAPFALHGATIADFAGTVGEVLEAIKNASASLTATCTSMGRLAGGCGRRRRCNRDHGR